MDVFENVHDRDKCVTERNEIIAYDIHGYPGQITECDIPKIERSKVAKVKPHPRVDGSGWSGNGWSGSGWSGSGWSGSGWSVPRTGRFRNPLLSIHGHFLEDGLFSCRAINFLRVKTVLFHSRTSGFCYLGLLFLENGHLAFTNRKSFYDEII